MSKNDGSWHDGEWTPYPEGTLTPCGECKACRTEFEDACPQLLGEVDMALRASTKARGPLPKAWGTTARAMAQVFPEGGWNAWKSLDDDRD